MAIEGHNPGTMSKTQHYRKVTKPLLERKRRARMNHYLDELKDLIVETMESQGEHVTKLEKADILEMTVSYLKTKKQCGQSSNGHTDQVNPEKFRAGYTQAAYEVSKVFASVPGLDKKFGTQLMKHLGYQLKDLHNKNANDTVSPKHEQEEFPGLQENAEQHPWRPW